MGYFKLPVVWWAVFLLVAALSLSTGLSEEEDKKEETQTEEKQDSSSEKEEESTDSEETLDTGSLIASAMDPNQAEMMQLMLQLAGMKDKDPNSPAYRKILERLSELSATTKAGKLARPAVPVKPRPVTKKPDAREPKRKPPVEPTSEPSSAKKEETTSQVMPSSRTEQTGTSAANASDTNGPLIEVVSNNHSPDAVIKLSKMKDDILNLQYLIDVVGKEMKFNIIYPDKSAIPGDIKLKLYGEIRRRDLVPMLESFLGFHGYALVREDPFVKIVKLENTLKHTKPRIQFGDDLPELGLGESIAAQIVEIKHIPVQTVTAFLGNFMETGNKVKNVPGTQSIIITEYAYRMPRIMEMIALIDKAGPKVSLIPVELKFLKSSDAKTKVMQLITELRKVKATAPGAKPATTPTAAKAKAKTRAKPARPSAQKGKNAAALAEVKTPILIEETRSNRLLVIGSDDDLQQVRDLLVLLDVPDGPDIRLEVLTPAFVEATEVVGQIEKLVEQLNPESSSGAATAPAAKKPAPKAGAKKATAAQRTSRTAARAVQSGKSGPYMLVDERTNRIFLIGSDEQIVQVKDLMGMLDVSNGQEIKLEIIKVQYVSASEVMDKIIDLIKALNNEETSEAGSRRVQAPRPGTAGEKKPSANAAARNTSRRSGRDRRGQKGSDEGPYLVDDERTNRLFVVGSTEQIQQARDLLGLLDVPTGPDIKLVPLFVEHVLAEELAGQISDIMQDLYQDDYGSHQDMDYRSDGRQGRTADRRQQTSRRDSNPRGGRDSRGRQSRDRGRSSGPIKISEIGPFIHPDERTNRMLVIGAVDQIEQVKKLQGLLDIPPHEYERLILKVYRPQFVEAEEVRRILEDLGIIKTDREPTARDRATSRDLRGDERREPERPRQPISPDAPDTTSEGLRGTMLLPGEEESEIRVAVQETINKIFVLATERQHIDIKEVMDHVDKKDDSGLGKIRIYPLENRDPEFVSGALTELLEATQDVQLSEDQTQRIPGVEGAPIVVSLDDIYAVAVSASEQQHKDIEKIIEELDKRLPQVLVEATLIQVSVDDTLELGISLQNDATVTGDATNPRLLSGVSPFGIGKGAAVAFFDDDQVYATLEVLQSTGNSKVISKPRILVNDNESGTIDSKRSEPTTTTTIPTGSNVPIITFDGYEDAGTTLTITPHIGDLNSEILQLEIELNVDNFEGEGAGDVPPPKAINSIQTLVTIPEGKTLILGGLTRVTDSVAVNQIPILGDIPILGVLFRNTARVKDRGVLYVFVRAYIVGREGINGDADFQDLIDLSDNAKKNLERSEEMYEGQSVIPGLPDSDRRNEKNVLEVMEDL
jgi:type II secretory pathway component GspD/PulD (secretin)